MSSINRALRERQTFVDVALQIYDNKLTPTNFEGIKLWDKF